MNRNKLITFLNYVQCVIDLEIQAMYGHSEFKSVLISLIAIIPLIFKFPAGTFGPCVPPPV